MKTYQQIVHDLRMVYPEGEARALARWLCEERFGLTQADLLLDKDNHLSADDLANVREITSRLLCHEPIQYILGAVTFCAHRFSVAPGVLIPRPETEELVRNILATIAADAAPRILDMGTGSGCIALSLALERPLAQVTSWDISEKALAVAQCNVDSYPDAHVCIERADILHAPADDRRWDIIVSNPPYVRQSEARQMEANVLQYEPHLALFVPDADPLLFYRAIAQYASAHLAQGGMLWLEINRAFGEETSHLIEESGFHNVMLLEDAYGNLRFVRGEKQY